MIYNIKSDQHVRKACYSKHVQTKCNTKLQDVGTYMLLFLTTIILNTVYQVLSRVSNFRFFRDDFRIAEIKAA